MDRKCSIKKCDNEATHLIQHPKGVSLKACADHVEQHRKARKTDGRLQESIIIELNPNQFGELFNDLWASVSAAYDAYDEGYIDGLQACTNALIDCQSFINKVNEAIDNIEHRCSECNNVLDQTDKERYEAQNGIGWPETCEDCADLLSSRFNKPLHLND